MAFVPASTVQRSAPVPGSSGIPGNRCPRADEAGTEDWLDPVDDESTGPDPQPADAILIPFGGADGVQAVRLLSARPVAAAAMVMVVKAVSPINGVLWSMVMPRPTSSTAIAM